MTAEGALLLLALAGGASAPPSVEVRVLEHHRPEAAVLSRPGERHRVSVEGGGLLLDGAPVPAPLRFPAGRWLVEAGAGGARAYRGSPSLAVEEGRLAIVLRMALEDYVEAVVASETVPGTPPEALKAQAVVVRSYALAAGRRHAGAALCDLAHCQVLAGEGRGAHRAAVRAAARATSGEVLWLGPGRPALAPFHAACGGHTGDPAQLFGGEGTGAAAVPDPGCPASPWSASLPAGTWAAVAAALLGPGAPLDPGELELRRGAGGFVVQIAAAGRSAGGEAFARRLDGALGHGAVRSSRFEARWLGDEVRLAGSGLGHGVGLCQAGAALRAARGEGYREILRHYFPAADGGGPDRASEARR